MFQAPATIGRRRQFSKAEIASITSGAKVHVRPVKAKPDPLLVLSNKFRYQTLVVVETEEDMDKARAFLDSKNAAVASIHHMNVLQDTTDIRMFSGHGDFFREDVIRKTVRRKRAIYQEEAREAKRALKNGHLPPIECQQWVTSSQRKLKRLPVAEKQLLAALAREKRRVSKLQRSVNYMGKMRAYSRAYAAMWKTFYKIQAAPLTSREGAIALIEVSEIILSKRAMIPTEVPRLLARSYQFLSNEKR